MGVAKSDFLRCVRADQIWLRMRSVSLGLIDICQILKKNTTIVDYESWEVQWFQILLGSLYPRSNGASRWSPAVLQGGSCWDLLGISTMSMWPNRKRRRAWTVTKRCDCSVFRLASSFRTWWYHLIPNSLRRHHWSRASVLCTFLLVTARTRNHTGRWVECKYYTASTWWIWRFVTSISDCPGSA